MQASSFASRALRSSAAFAVDLTVVGGSPCALFTAWAAAQAGARVVLRVPAGGAGRGFRSLEQDGRRLDLGARRFILAPRPEAPAPLSEYRADGPSRPFLGHAVELLASIPDVVLQDVPQSTGRVAGVTGPDPQSTLDLVWICETLGQEFADRVRRETAGREEALVLEADTPLEPYSRALHGAAFHEAVIAPFAQKVFPEGWRAMPARLAGKIWAPVIWPDTLANAAEGRVVRGRDPLVSSYPASGAFGDVIEALERACAAHPAVIVEPYGDLRAAEGAVALDGDTMEADLATALCLSAQELGAACGVARGVWERFSLDVAWLEVPAEALATESWLLNVFDGETPIFRVGRGGVAASPDHVILGVEMTGGAGLSGDAEALREALVSLEVLRPDAVVRWSHHVAEVPLLAPSAANARRLHGLHQRLGGAARDERGPALRLLGGSSQWGGDTVVDQLLHAASAAERLTSGAW